MNLLSGDRLFALVRLRQISLGDEVELELSCPNSACRMTNFVTVNLEDLKVTPYGEEREFVFKLPGSKKAVRFGYLDGHKEKRLASLRRAPTISSAMLIRILDIDGKAPTKKSLAEMSMRDRNALRQEMSAGRRGNRHLGRDRMRWLRHQDPYPPGGRTGFFVPRSSLVSDAFFLAYGGLHWAGQKPARCRSGSGVSSSRPSSGNLILNVSKRNGDR